MPITTYSKDRVVNISPPRLYPDTKKTIHTFKEVTPPGHMAETPTCTNCILGTQRDPSRASPFIGDLEDGWNDWKRLLIEKRER